MEMSMAARILQERDAKRYLELRRQAASECAGRATKDLREELFLLAVHPPAGLSRHDTVVWGVHDGHLLAGTLAVSRRFNVHFGNHLWLWGLYVRPRYRGTPASRSLMDSMLAWCRSVPADERLLGSCHASDQRAKLFLARWGFQAMGLTAGPMVIRGMEAGDLLFERERDQERE